MHKILLDTNIFIYIEDYKITDDDIIKLTQELFDSEEYKIVIHPNTKKEANKIKDSEKRAIFLSKISVYPEIINPPKADKKFHDLVGCHNSHDEIDNDMLFAIKRNCASYLITNDNDLRKKSKIVGLEEKVLSVSEALEKFHDNKIDFSHNSTFIEQKKLHNLDISDSFFSSLKNDYSGFEKWFAKKQEQGASAYVTFDDNAKIKAFLMLKQENENEPYNDFTKTLLPKKRLKVSTLKVTDNGKKIGEAFMKIIIENAIKLNVDEIYITLYPKQSLLIDLLTEYGFKKFCNKVNVINGVKCLEDVYIKQAKPVEEYYPFLNPKDRKVFIVPIQEKYHNLLFRDIEPNIQLSIMDTKGLYTSSNCIKKAYLSDSKITTITPGSILLFYSSGNKKAITCLGIVDAVFNKFDNFDDLYNVVRKRTAYNENELRNNFKTNKLVILFKLYYFFENYVSREFLLKNNIIKYNPQSIIQIKEAKDKKLQLILDESKFESNKYIVKE